MKRRPRAIPDLNARHPKVEPLQSRYLSRVPAIVTMVGHTGSGKSYLAVGLIQLMKREGTITHLFVLSPTASSNTLYRNIVDPTRDHVYSDIGPNVFKSLDEVVSTCEGIGDAYRTDLQYAIAHRKFTQGEPITHVDEALLETRGFMPVVPRRPSFALFVDDCQGSAIFSRGSKNSFPNLVLRSRHVADGLGLTIIMAAQTMKSGVPRSLRLNSTHWAFFKTLNRRELDEMYEEVSGFCSKEHFERQFNWCTNAPHGYLWADLQSQTLSNSF